jgi:5-methylcytosine-specific restriction enzyme subunit McrC
MMAYAQLYLAPRLTLLYPHHPGLGTEDVVHARHRITGHPTILETASIDVANSEKILDRIRRLLIGDEAIVEATG